jgi:hypothetical protein
LSSCAGKGASAGRRGSLVSIIFFKLETLRGRQSITSVREGRGTEGTETSKARSTSQSKHPPPPVRVQKGMAKRNRYLGKYTEMISHSQQRPLRRTSAERSARKHQRYSMKEPASGTHSERLRRQLDDLRKALATNIGLEGRHGLYVTVPQRPYSVSTSSNKRLA